MLVTGGEVTGETVMKRVARYDIDGYIEDLPPLNIGRAAHGCGAYLNDVDGSQVGGCQYSHSKVGKVCRSS